MNSKSSDVPDNAPSKDLVESLGWKEESPGVYVGGKECSGEVELSSIIAAIDSPDLVTIDPSEWDEKLDQVQLEASDTIELRVHEVLEGIATMAPDPTPETVGSDED